MCHWQLRVLLQYNAISSSVLPEASPKQQQCIGMLAIPATVTNTLDVVHNALWWTEVNNMPHIWRIHKHSKINSTDYYPECGGRRSNLNFIQVETEVLEFHFPSMFSRTGTNWHNLLASDNIWSLFLGSPYHSVALQWQVQMRPQVKHTKVQQKWHLASKVM